MGVMGKCCLWVVLAVAVVFGAMYLGNKYSQELLVQCDQGNYDEALALLKYGALMGRNTSKDKWKPQESKKHSTQTRHKDKVAQLALQGIVLLTEEEEKELELDPEKVRGREERSDEPGMRQLNTVYGIRRFIWF